MLRVVDSTFADDEREFIDPSEVDENFVGINDATRLLNFRHAQYTRRLVLQGKLGALKLQYPHYTKWMIDLRSIAAYEVSTRRTSNLRRYIVRFDRSNEAKVREALESLDIAFELELSYQKTTK